MNVNDDKPLLIPGKAARKKIGVGNTKYYQLVGEGKIQTVKIGSRRLALNSSLEKLVADLVKASA